MKEATLKQAGIGLKPQNIYSITVNYDRSIEDAVRAGNYDWTNSGINSKNFSTKKSGVVEVEVELVHFNRDISTEEVLKELGEQGQRPAELHELLALGEKYPDLQREFPIIALGSVWQSPVGSRLCACLVRFGSERDLDLSWSDLRCSDPCSFVAVSK